MRRGGAAMAEPLACAQCGARDGGAAPGRVGCGLRSMRSPYGRARRTGLAGTCSGTDCAAAEGYGRAACLRPVRCERRPNSAWPGRPTPAPVRDCPTAERAGLGWLALAPVRPAQRRRATSGPRGSAALGASGGRTVPGCAGRHLRRYATALRPSAPDWAGWRLLRYGLPSGGGLLPGRVVPPRSVRAAAERCLAVQADTCAGTRLPYGRARRTGLAGACSGTACPAAAGYFRAAWFRRARCERRPNGAWLCRPTPAPVRDCPTAERAGLGWL